MASRPYTDDDVEPKRKRRNRTAAQRRDQRLRAEVRTIQHLIKGFRAMQHRGNQVSKIGAVLQRTLQHLQDTGEDAKFATANKGGQPGCRDLMPICWHHRQGTCTFGQWCRFRHTETYADLNIVAPCFEPQVNDEELDERLTQATYNMYENLATQETMETMETHMPTLHQGSLGQGSETDREGPRLTGDEETAHKVEEEYKAEAEPERRADEAASQGAETDKESPRLIQAEEEEEEEERKAERERKAEDAGIQGSETDTQGPRLTGSWCTDENAKTIETQGTQGLLQALQAAEKSNTKSQAASSSSGPTEVTNIDIGLLRFMAKAVAETAENIKDMTIKELRMQMEELMHLEPGGLRPWKEEIKQIALELMKAQT